MRDDVVGSSVRGQSVFAADGASGPVAPAATATAGASDRPARPTVHADARGCRLRGESVRSSATRAARRAAHGDARDAGHARDAGAHLSARRCQSTRG